MDEEMKRMENRICHHFSILSHFFSFVLNFIHFHSHWPGKIKFFSHFFFFFFPFVALHSMEWTNQESEEEEEADEEYKIWNGERRMDEEGWLSMIEWIHSFVQLIPSLFILSLSSLPSFKKRRRRRKLSVKWCDNEWDFLSHFSSFSLWKRFFFCKRFSLLFQSICFAVLHSSHFSPSSFEKEEIWE